MKPARILLLLVAIVAGGLAAFLATRGSAPVTVVEHDAAAPQPPTATKVLVAKQPIGVGQRLNAGSVEWQPWPDNAVRPEYITIAKSPDAATKISGAVARFEIFEGEPILDGKLAHSDQGFLSAVLEPGMRGVSVLVSAASGSGGFIIPNDRVDIVVTSNVAGQTLSRVLLSDVKVLAIGTRLGQSGTTGAPADPADPKSQIFNGDVIATLELTPAQGDTLINATAQGRVSLVLRSVADFGQNGPQTITASGPAQDDQTVKVIRFGHLLSVTPGANQGSQAMAAALTAPVAYVAPSPAPFADTSVVAAPPPTVVTTGPDGAVTTVTTSTPAGVTPVTPVTVDPDKPATSAQ